MTLRIEETEDTSRMLAAGYEPNQTSIDLDFYYWDDEYADLNPVTVAAAVAAVASAAPYGDPLYGLRLQTTNLRPLAKFAGTAAVHYGKFEPRKENKIRVGFSTSGASEHVTHSLSTIGSHAAAGEEAPTNWGRAINVTKDGPQGASRESGALAIRITSYFSPANWNHAQWITMRDLSKAWNLYDWHGWPANSLQFQNCEAAEFELGTGDLVPVTFHFLVGRPELVTKPGGISFTKHPWSLVWDMTRPAVDPTNGLKGLKVVWTYEEQLYLGADFALLGIGS